MARITVDLTQNIHLAYVYCELLDNVTVGDTKPPLLRIVDFQTTTERGKCTSQLEPFPLHTL